MEHGNVVAALPPYRGDIFVVVARFGFGLWFGMQLEPGASFFAEQFEIGEFFGHGCHATSDAQEVTNRGGVTADELCPEGVPRRGGGRWWVTSVSSFV